MMMRLRSENELFDGSIRKAIIEEINGIENQDRKREAWRRYQCYKDLTRREVISQLETQWDPTTVKEMEMLITNVSFCRKIIDKLARVYSNGVIRMSDNDDITEKISRISDELDVDTNMKRVNRFLKLHRNLPLYIKPYPTELNQDMSPSKWSVKLEPTQPYLYDAVESYWNREVPICFVFSTYRPRQPVRSSIEPAKEGRGLSTFHQKPRGDQKDQIIADEPADDGANREEYIWWSNSYHFTTNGKGEIVKSTNLEPIEESLSELLDENNPMNILNPIGVLPVCNFAVDQDNSFYALGGSDLVDTSILCNVLLSNLNYIGILQGYATFIMTGSNLPRIQKVGPNQGIILEHEKDDPTPDAKFISANPPMDQLAQNIELLIALMLTTNNLSISSVSAQLGQGQNAASGVSLMIDKAESLEDVEDQRQIFFDKEPIIWDIINRWIKFYEDNGMLDESLAGLSLPDDFDLKLTFGDPRPIMSEIEKLDILQKRKDLGLNTMIDLMMKDDPDITRKEAQEKLLKIQKEKTMRMINAMLPSSDDSEEEEQEEEEQTEAPETQEENPPQSQE